MADLLFTKLIVGGQTYVIPEVNENQSGLLTAEDYKKFKEMAETGGQPNVIESVKVNGTALSIASKAVDILIAAGTQNGSLSVNGKDILITGLAALAFKSQISQTDLDAALDAVIKAKAEQTAVTEINNILTTLQGDGTTGSIKKMISDAIDTFASDVNDNGKIDKIAEVLKWFNEVDEDGSGKELIADVQGLKKILIGIGGTSEPATVQAYVAQELNKLTLSSISGLEQALGEKVDKVPGKELSTNDFTNELKDKLNGIDTGATKNTASYDSATLTLTLTGFSAAASA